MKNATTTEVKIGIIGGGLMGREMASAFGRWFALRDLPMRPVLAGVADANPTVLEWFRALPSPPDLLVTDYRELLARADIDVVYVAVPHHLHEKIYCDVVAAGKDLLAEKPFGIDLGAARRIVEAVEKFGKFVRCSSEFPYFPGAQRVIKHCQGGSLGRVLEIRSGFHHASDLDPNKSANWKRLGEFCGEAGVLNDLGLHVCHIPLRLGWRPGSVYAQLQKGHAQRPDGHGGFMACDTWDNASLNTWTQFPGQQEPVPMRLEMKRLAPGATNTWFLEVLGTEGGARYSTAEPKSLHLFHRLPEQAWERIDLGFETAFPTVTGHIFEPGFPDIIQQMWAAYLMERAGLLSDKFGCARPEEAVASHELFAAALVSQNKASIVTF